MLVCMHFIHKIPFKNIHLGIFQIYYVEQHSVNVLAPI